MMAFDQIDAARRRLNVSQSELCRRADINETTYVRAIKGRGQMRGRTLRKLQIALQSFDSHASEQEAEA